MYFGNQKTCAFFFSVTRTLVPSTKTNHCLPLASPGDLRTSGYRTLPGGAEGCLDAAGRGVGWDASRLDFLL